MELRGNWSEYQMFDRMSQRDLNTILIVRKISVEWKTMHEEIECCQFLSSVQALCVVSVRVDFFFFVCLQHLRKNYF